MRYRTVDCCPMAATQKMSCAPLSPLAASSAGSFNNSPVNSGILPTDSPEEPLKHAYARLIDDGFVEGKDYASALIDETPAAVTVPFLKKLVDRGSYEHKHREYLRALWARLLKEERAMLVSCLGAELDKELPKGRWWPLLKMMCELGIEGWRGLSPRIRLRL